ncbi:glycosyltransferase involved in cell wall biosynthesis [Silvimonas terrae]|uniref:Glycosyltransferase involved in cell wall biosynthesis n=1 Tax=Silvimonas terrae TaxID=300266 RepID=A0A840RB58_9NEIS|nr:peptide transporter [Silvimonas terrae]MBB5189580.1 glycosyltransferase involved in cell wall biosynthesis [Silvimonas terrae]
MTDAVDKDIAGTDGAAQPAETTNGNAGELAFSLERFEALAYAREHEAAMGEFMRFLHMLDRNYGALDMYFEARMTAPRAGLDVDPHIINRICSALSALFSDPNFYLSGEGARRLLFLHRWISTLFAASTFGNADHILRALNLNGPGAESVQIRHEHVLKFCVLYTPNSEIPLDMDAMWAFNKYLAASLACSLLSPRFLGMPSAHHKREILLPWLAAKLDEIEDLNVLPVQILHDIYMHCSYADGADRHAIKAPINRLVRKKLLEQNITDIEFKPKKKPKGEKPVMLVVLEWFSGAHSIYRTHSASLRAAREKFKIVGVGMKDLIDDLGREVFDEFREVQGEAVPFVRELAETLRPDLVYYPAFGMFPSSIFLTNLRLAPVQVVSYGHPATSKSPFIDYFVLPEDWVGDPACFSEKLLALPKEAMPFVPSTLAIDIEPKLRVAPETLRIAVATTGMKLNPNFMRTLRRIQQEASQPVEFHFLMGSSRGLMYLEIQRFIQTYLPTAIIHSHLPYAEYLAMLNECDLYANPFPFGNTNGIVDVTAVGLVGVCKTGPEVLEHIDEALFRRIGLPGWLIAKDEDEYVAAALRLIEDEKLRLDLRRQLLKDKAAEVFFKGAPEQFGVALAKLI